jgi:ADP-ribosylglycohydrolase
MDKPSTVSAALGALRGVALGDALGAPTQSWDRATIVARFGSLIPSFVDADADHPYAAGLSAGHVTDDTEQSVLVAELLLRGNGAVSTDALATMLLSWEKSVVQRGLRDLLGPSTKKALDAWRSGVAPGETGLTGVTNGAAMRVTPVGIATEPVRGIVVDRVVMVSGLTHRTDVALGAAGFIAATVSALVDGQTWSDATAWALTVADECSLQGVTTTGRKIVEALDEALRVPNGLGVDALIEWVTQRFGVDVRAVASVPAAVAIATAAGNTPWEAVRIGASAGDDTDTMASLIGALVGARHGSDAFPPDAVAFVEKTNTLDLEGLAQRLITLRR